MKNAFNTAATRDIALAVALDKVYKTHTFAALQAIANSHGLSIGLGRSNQLHLLQMKDDLLMNVWQDRARCGVDAFPARIQHPLHVKCVLSTFAHKAMRIAYFDWPRIQQEHGQGREEVTVALEKAWRLIVHINSRIAPDFKNAKCYTLSYNTRSFHLVGAHLVALFRKNGVTGNGSSRGLEQAQGTGREHDSKAVPPNGKHGEQSIARQTLKRTLRLYDSTFRSLSLRVASARARARNNKQVHDLITRLLPRAQVPAHCALGPECCVLCLFAHVCCCASPCSKCDL